MTNTVQVHGKTVAQPRYISSHTHLYKNLIAAHGHMKAFGLDLADTLFTHHTPAGYIPYGAIIAVAIGLQYFQMRQLNSRNPAAAQANPQMQMMQRYMPLIFAIIYIRIASGENLYFVISSLCRIGIQEACRRSCRASRREANAATRARKQFVHSQAACKGVTNTTVYWCSRCRYLADLGFCSEI